METRPCSTRMRQLVWKVEVLTWIAASIGRISFACSGSTGAMSPRNWAVSAIPVYLLLASQASVVEVEDRQECGVRKVGRSV